jgi:hypothetical protein
VTEVAHFKASLEDLSERLIACNMREVLAAGDNGGGMERLCGEIGEARALISREVDQQVGLMVHQKER